MAGAQQLSEVSSPSRVADPDEGVSLDELALAARNHGFPLEALRHDVTPVGLHYLLTHYDIPFLEAADFELVIDGLVDRELRLDLSDLRARPAVTARVTLECAGNGRARLLPRPISQPWLVEAVGTAEWTGTPLAPLLREAGVLDDVVDVVFGAADHGVERGVEQDYERSLPLAEALRDDVLLVYEMNGGPLPPQHGFPLRLVVPGWYGMAHVKWLTRITLVDEPFDGYQMRAYRLRQDSDDPGVPVTRIEPRALVQPPGFPDFMTRARLVRPGQVHVTGRAWSGWAPVDGVEVTVDGHTWHAATVVPGAGAWEWASWSWTWDATPGDYVLGARARDRSGRIQPVDPPWNRGGFANNLVQRVPITVLGAALPDP